MNSRKVIEQFKRRTIYASVFLASVKGIVRAIPVLVGGFLFISAIDGRYDVSSILRQMLWLLTLFAGVAAVASGFWPRKIFKLSSRSRWVASRLTSKVASLRWFRWDELRIVSELSQAGERHASQDLIEAEVDRVAAALKSASAFWAFPDWSFRKYSMVAVVFLTASTALWATMPSYFPLTSRIWFPFASAQIQRFISIHPGDIQVPYGGDAEVRVTLLAESQQKPTLAVKTDREWLEINPDDEQGDSQIFVFSKVVQQVSYRVQWRKETSRRFTITPVKPIRVESIKITLVPPAYLGDKTITQTSPEVSGLVGTQVKVHAVVSEPIRSATLQLPSDAEKPADSVSGKEITASFVIAEAGEYGFKVIPTAGAMMLLPDRYPIHVLTDESPAIKLVSPDQDLVVGINESLPLTFEASDDHGLSEIRLIYERSSSPAVSRVVKRLPAGEVNVFETYDWPIADSIFSPGDIVRYRLEVVDANTVTGPGRTLTPWLLIEVASFEKGHEAMEQALQAWRDAALDTLADVNTFKAKAEQQTNPMSELSQRFSQTQQNAQNLEQFLKRIVDQMEKDPLADYGVWMEHEAMLDSLQKMNRETMRDIQASLQTNNKQQALEDLEQSAAELERMTALSEELSKQQNAKDVLDASEQLEQAGEDLMNQMKAAAEEGKLDAQAMAQVQNLLKKAEEMLGDLARSLQQMPQELPEDFVNQQALKQLDLAKSQDIMKQIDNAIKRGDMKEALRLAEQFLNAAKQMREQVSKAHEEYTNSNSAEKLAEEISEKQKKLEDITNEQLRQMTETQKLDSKRMEALLKEQDKLLQELAQRQNKVLFETRRMNSQRKLPIRVQVISELQTPYMQKILEEFNASRLQTAPQLLGDVVAQLGAGFQLLEESTPTADVKGEMSWIVEEERAILEKLKTPPQMANPFSQKDGESFKQLEKGEQELSKKTEELRKDIQTLSRKTASLGLPVTGALSKAADGMKSAAHELGDKDSVNALRAQEEALRHLLEGQAAMEEAQSGMSGLAQRQGSGQGMGGTRVMTRGGQGRGTQTGQVRLPRVDEYRPPKEFREELLKALKEKYPEVYEDVIHKYFKRLAE